jgi:hypothetical protein
VNFHRVCISPFLPVISSPFLPVNCNVGSKVDDLFAAISLNKSNLVHDKSVSPFYSQGLFERISESSVLISEERISDACAEWTKVEDGGWISPSIWQSRANSIQFSSMFDVSTTLML